MLHRLVLPFALLFSLNVAHAAEAEKWYPSKYGAKDEIGALNLLNAESVLNAATLIKTGKTYPLAVPIDKNLPAFRHRSFHLTNIQPGEAGGTTMGPNKFTFNDELVVGWTGVGTQLNGIGHIGIDNVYYNGNRAADFVTVEGVQKLGIEKVPPIVTRGVVLDMTAVYGSAIVPEKTEFSVADIQKALDLQGITIQKGDVVLFNTGWLELLGKDNEKFLAVEPGIGMAAAKWLADKQIVAFGGDTWASEIYPGTDGQEFPVNQFMLAKNGIYNLEQFDLLVKLPVSMRALIEPYGVISRAGADLSPAAALLINELQQGLTT